MTNIIIRYLTLKLLLNWVINIHFFLITGIGWGGGGLNDSAKFFIPYMICQYIQYSVGFWSHLLSLFFKTQTKFTYFFFLRLKNDVHVNNNKKIHLQNFKNNT